MPATLFVLVLELGGCSDAGQTPPDAAVEVQIDTGSVDAPGAAVEAQIDTGAGDAFGDAVETQIETGPVGVFLDSVEIEGIRESGASFFGGYVTEVLAHAGMPHVLLSRTDLAGDLSRIPVILVPYRSWFDAQQTQALQAYVRRGGTLVVMGGTSGLESLLGVDPVGYQQEGYLQPLDSSESLGALGDPLHVFSTTPLRLTSATEQASMLDAEAEPTGLVGIARRVLGRGEAWTIGADLAQTVVRIQQGKPIATDGEPAPEGSADIDDDILKTDDGIVLDWDIDRSAIGGDSFFRRPVADELKEVLLRIAFGSYSRKGHTLPLLWYWPGDLDAVGVLSHDTDSNIVDRADQLLQEIKALGIESTWCFIQYPETYPQRVFAEVTAAGGEVALHFDAMKSYGLNTQWNESHFVQQLEWLRGLSGEAPVVTNKNHYLRWEGWADFYRWCEAAGIQADQSKGPSKSGNVGFLYGTSHPYFPIDDLAHGNRLIDVLSVNTLAQDLVLTCPYAFGPALVDSALRHYGVAHFLFHPQHVVRQEVREAMRRIVAYGKSAGLAWWTVARVNAWERARRALRIERVSLERFDVVAPVAMPNATFLIVLPGDATGASIRQGGQELTHRLQQVYGVPMARVTADLEPGRTTFQVVFER